MRCSLVIALPIALLSSVSAEFFLRRGLDSLPIVGGLLGGSPKSGDGDKNSCADQQSLLANVNVLSSVHCSSGAGGPDLMACGQSGNSYHDGAYHTSADCANN
ncbi:uncharacterized protein PGTG_02317 [Puccinia graminis f. sp. tritici CRL 75-36-700-3]|uniref:Uncharacterized protein n=1 Tax=Puccinia graminis f. sp. tritici (strain CRL 75-36-700-3 / race SCCL) TaxID=418459 RepID=E3JXT1_PUCGT|nr:uncharacterized protein PGTG_02317 [Puccinia graminis f. sp. tritici CRL 75-36-700-3]EFP76856.2 hypothetical protein PGTG_02317 [Puccinia graminis f. sp. tritici CRL 75-36-700-3]